MKLWNTGDLMRLSVLNIDPEYEKDIVIRKFKSILQENVVDGNVNDDSVVATLDVIKDFYAVSDRSDINNLMKDLEQPDLGYETNITEDGNIYSIKLPKGTSFNKEIHSINQIEAKLFAPAWFIKFVLYLNSNKLKSSDKIFLNTLLSKTTEMVIDQTNAKLEHAYFERSRMNDKFIGNLYVTVDFDGAFEKIAGSKETYVRTLERIAEQSGVFNESSLETEDLPKLFEYALKPSLVDRLAKVIQVAIDEDIENENDKYLIESFRKEGVDWFTQTELGIKHDTDF